MTTPAAEAKEKEEKHPATIGPTVHCEHGGAETEELVAAPQLTVLPTLEPLALDVGGPPPLTTKAPPPLPPPPSSSLPLLPPRPSSPRAAAAPQDDVAGTPEDVEDVAAVMSMTGGGGGPAGAIEKEKKAQPTATTTPTGKQQQEPPTPAARLPSAALRVAAAAARARPSSPIAMVGPPLLLSEEESGELPTTPPSSPVQEEKLTGAMGGGAKPPHHHHHHHHHHPHPTAAPPPAAAPAAAPPAAAAAPTMPAWQAASRRRVAAAREGIFVDEQEQRSPEWLSRWPVTAPQLLLLARDAVATGVHESPLLDRRSGAFDFSAPFVGPIKGADAFAKTMTEVGIDEAFDVKPQAFAFTLDPLEEGRVWFFTRPLSKFARPLKTGGPSLPPLPPTGEVIVSPPQVASLKFSPVENISTSEQGGDNSWADDPLLPPVRCRGMTYGYVCDRRQGTTGGLGGAFGILFAVGRPFPFPEGRPWRSSWQQTLFNRYGSPGRAVAWAADRVLQAAWPWGAPVATARNAP